MRTLSKEIYMFRLPIQIAARCAIYYGVRSYTSNVLTENFHMDPDSVELPATVSGVIVQYVAGPYTDGIVNRVADKIQRRREQAVAE